MFSTTGHQRSVNQNHFTPTRMAKEKNLEKLKLSHIADGIVNGAVTLENSLAVPENVKYRINICFSLVGMYPPKMKTYVHIKP